MDVMWPPFDDADDTTPRAAQDAASRSPSAPGDDDREPGVPASPDDSDDVGEEAGYGYGV
jgi:hypothetical protein